MSLSCPHSLCFRFRYIADADDSDEDLPDSDKIRRYYDVDLIKDGIRIFNDSIGSKPDGILVQYVPVEEGMRDWHFDTVLLNEAQYVKRAIGKYNAMLRLFKYDRVI